MAMAGKGKGEKKSGNVVTGLSNPVESRTRFARVMFPNRCSAFTTVRAWRI